MKITVVTDDRLVIVNGEGLEILDGDFDVDIHAIQYNDVYTTIEFKTPDGGVMGVPASSYEVQPYLDMWKAEKARLEALEAPTETPSTIEGSVT